MLTDVIYLEDSGLIYFSPDGIGKIYFDSVEDATEETGITKLCIVVSLED